MSVLVVARIAVNPQEPIALATYIETTGPLLARAGARVISEFKLGEALVGRSTEITMFVVEYPSRAAIDLVFQSEAYLKLVPARDRAFLIYETSIADSVPH